MPWLTVAVEVDAAAAERLDDAFFEAGALAVETTDAAAGTPQEQAYYGETDTTALTRWATSRVTALFPADVTPAAVAAVAMRAAGVPPATPYRVSVVDDRDWVRASRDQYQPTKISPRLWIVPSWHAPPDPRAVNVLLDPGMAFGTGTHPSTRLCLRWIDAHIRGGETVIDFGCGSGILAIAALKLGAASARGVDIDPQALLAAERNAMQNQVAARFVAAASAGDEPAQRVVANILANPLIVLAPLLAKLTVKEGRIALSGILLDQAGDVRSAYAPWFAMGEIESEEGWAMLRGVRKAG
ncbi:MAG: 50S ribosomal protein L11 methyltransferase [Betaproteobacteria bacterium]